MTKLSRVAATLATSAMLVAPVASQAATTTAFSPGDLIKGSGSTVYYFGPDGRRYVFPNDKTYFTWFSDFSKVKQVPDGVLGTIPLARQNITYRPGKKMVKITTDPRTYVVDQGGVLRHIGSEQLAETLYGLNWKNQIDDVPDALRLLSFRWSCYCLLSTQTGSSVPSFTLRYPPCSLPVPADLLSVGSQSSPFRYSRSPLPGRSRRPRSGSLWQRSAVRAKQD
jgi:hypothetical protein